MCNAYCSCDKCDDDDDDDDDNQVSFGLYSYDLTATGLNQEITVSANLTPTWS